ncbi:tetratricopeptide repeat protein [bacterium]|nr:tetratricopeptide repeat protein [bacterium]
MTLEHLINRRGFVLSLLACLCFFVFFNSIHNDFALDDHYHIHQNEIVKELSRAGELFLSPTWPGNLYRPLSELTFTLNYYWGAENPSGYHIFNICLHILVCWLVFWMIKRISGVEIAFWTALIFAVHPLHVEAVTGIVDRTELLAALFLLAGIYFVERRYVRDRKIYTALSFLFFLCALMSKESALSACALAPLFFIAQQPNKSGLKSAATSTILVFLAGITYLFFRFHALGAVLRSEDRPFYVVNPLVALELPERIFNGIVLLGHYIRLSIIPWPLTTDYSYSKLKLVTPVNIYEHALEFGNLLLILSLISIILWSIFRRDQLKLYFFGLWFVFSFIITSNIFFVTGTIFAERLAYLGSIGICGLIALTLRNFLSRRLAVSAGVSICIIFSLLSVKQNTFWLSNEVLQAHALEVSPESAKANQNYAIACFNQGKLSEAEFFLKRALKIYPQYADAAYRLSLLYNEMRKNFLVEHWLKVALEIEPRHALALRNLCLLYYQTQRSALADQLAKSALERWPEDPQIKAVVSELKELRAHFITFNAQSNKD